MKKYLVNLVWMLSDRVLLLVFQLYIFSSIKRLYDVNVLGGWATINNLSQILMSFFMLGIDVVVIKRIIENKDNAGEEIGTAITIQLVGALIYSIFFYLIIHYFYQDIPNSNLYYFVFVVANFFSIFAKTVFWHYSALLEAKLRATTIIVSVSLSFIVTYLSVQRDSNFIFYAFAIFYFIQFMLSIAIYLLCYVDKKKWVFSKEKLGLYTKAGLKLIISTLSVAIFVQADTLMLEKMTNLYEVGVFNAALKISSIWFFVAGIIASAFFPKIVSIKSDSQQALFLMKWMTGTVSIITIAVSIFIVINGHYIISFMYDESMDKAAGVLSIHIWSSIFVFMGAFSSKWLFAHDEINIEVIKTVIAAIFNVLMNYFIIPLYGAIGASLVSFLAYFIANVLVLLCIKRTRSLILSQLKGFLYLIKPAQYLSDTRKVKCLFQ